ncbi:unnamed protein product, partial [Chrysoparadoxa australica]
MPTERVLDFNARIDMSKPEGVHACCRFCWFDEASLSIDCSCSCGSCVSECDSYQVHDPWQDPWQSQSVINKELPSTFVWLWRLGNGNWQLATGTGRQRGMDPVYSSPLLGASEVVARRDGVVPVALLKSSANPTSQAVTPARLRAKIKPG